MYDITNMVEKFSLATRVGGCLLLLFVIHTARALRKSSQRSLFIIISSLCEVIRQHLYIYSSSLYIYSSSLSIYSSSLSFYGKLIIHDYYSYQIIRLFLFPWFPFFRIIQKFNRRGMDRMNGSRITKVAMYKNCTSVKRYKNI